MVDRNPRLLKMARGRRCLLQLPGCRGGGETVVAAHSNSQAHGKGMGIKAGDQWSVWGCGPCHALLDQGGLSRQEQERVFAAAHERQVSAWRRVAADPHEAPADRAAAAWAIEAVFRQRGEA